MRPIFLYMRVIRCPGERVYGPDRLQRISSLTPKSITVSPTLTRMINRSVRQSSAIHDQTFRWNRPNSVSRSIHVSRLPRTIIKCNVTPHILCILSHWYPTPGIHFAVVPANRWLSHMDLSSQISQYRLCRSLLCPPQASPTAPWTPQAHSSITEHIGDFSQLLDGYFAYYLTIEARTAC
jgi:hypothetical protein